MASLRETKDRIGSVRSTLKITSAMKLVASSKLRKAQNAIEALRPYEDAFQSILKSVLSSGVKAGLAREDSEDGCVAVVAIASNSSLCGGFNANAVRRALDLISDVTRSGSPAQPGSGVVVYSIGRKMAEAMKKAGFASPEDLSALASRPSYEEAGRLAAELSEGYCKGKYSKVILVYNHFVSTAKQTVVTETFLPLGDVTDGSPAQKGPEYFIMEPSAGEIAESLLPEVLKLKLYAAVLDSAAAEHAARTVAMQTATDNAQELLADLTLEYNKGRQQKITAEILDLVGGRQ